MVTLLFVVPSAYFFTSWMLPLSSEAAPNWIRQPVSLLVAVALGGFVWVKLAAPPRRLIPSVFFGAVLLGGVGFTAGFFGPLTLWPEANQGPLLGLFITGPLGGLVGGMLGLIHWRNRRSL